MNENWQGGQTFSRLRLQIISTGIRGTASVACRFQSSRFPSACRMLKLLTIQKQTVVLKIIWLRKSERTDMNRLLNRSKKAECSWGTNPVFIMVFSIGCSPNTSEFSTCLHFPLESSVSLWRPLQLPPEATHDREARRSLRKGKVQHSWGSRRKKEHGW